MSIALAGRVVVVIGVSGVTGPAVTDGLAAAGTFAALVGPDRKQLEAAAAAFRHHGAQAFALTVDCTDATAVARMRAHIEQRLGPIDLVILLAPSDEVRRLAVAEFGPDLRRRARGHIVVATEDDDAAAVLAAAGQAAEPGAVVAAS